MVRSAMFVPPCVPPFVFVSSTANFCEFCVRRFVRSFSQICADVILSMNKHLRMQLEGGAAFALVVWQLAQGMILTIGKGQVRPRVGVAVPV
jgi:hypothetical protein